jgi:hypothetical protein
MRSLLNRYLKRFNLKLVSDGRHICKKCNTNYGGLPTIMGVDYVYENVFEIDHTSKSGEYYPYGWVIESSWYRNGSWSSFDQQWNRKVYMSQQSALEALVQFQTYDPDDFETKKYRLVPIYNLPKSETRKIKISKIINKN